MPIGTRKFGVEIECVGLTRNAIASALSRVGLDCEVQDYNHARRNYWKVVTDGSLQDNEGRTTAELVSPPLFGEAGLEEVAKAARAIASAGATVNRTCGLHVHVDARGLESVDLANLLRRYNHFESDIDSMMPISRRENRNNFCMSLREIVRNSRIESTLAETFDSPSRFVRALVGESRYYKLNLAAFLRHGTVEFRQHSGTVNAYKIVNWIQFCVNFVEQSIVPRPTTQGQPVQNQLHPVSQILRRDTLSRTHRIIVDALFMGSERPETLARLVNCNISSIPSMISAIRRFGYVIKKNRRRGVYVFISGPEENNRTPIQNPRTRLSALPPIRPDDTLNAGLSNETISFFMERIAELNPN